MAFNKKKGLSSSTANDMLFYEISKGNDHFMSLAYALRFALWDSNTQTNATIIA